MSDIEKDFDTYAKEINAKVKEAAAALRKANDLACEAGLPGLIYGQWTRDDDHTLDELSEEDREKLEADENWDGEKSPLEMKYDLIDVSDLEDQIESAGWSTSSSYC